MKLWRLSCIAAAWLSLGCGASDGAVDRGAGGDPNTGTATGGSGAAGGDDAPDRPRVCGDVDLDAVQGSEGYSGRGVSPHGDVKGSYAEALQTSLLFWEAQESGLPSAENRLDWRGPAHLDDGSDIGLDVSGGWYDAGDHWKANDTMAQGASMLAWSVISYEQAYTRSKQLRWALNSLGHVTDYFERAIDDGAPDDLNNFSNYRVVIDVGGRLEGAPDPGVHKLWCAPEVTNDYPVREAVVVNPQVPGADVAGSMAGAMAATAIVFDRYCDRSRAQRLYDRAHKLLNFGLRHRSGSSERALRPNGRIATGGMRGEDQGRLAWGAVWMHRAAVALGIEGYNGAFLNQARQVIDEDFKGLSLWWKDQVYNHGTLLAYLEAGAGDDTARFEEAVREHLKRWDEAKTSGGADTDHFWVTPRGMKVRQVYRGFFSSTRVLTQAALAALFADYSDSPADERYFDFAKHQLDYFLGANEQRQSYMVGFGERWPELQHHRTAHGSWAGHESRTASNPDGLMRMRHVLYGAMLPGPNGQGVYDPNSWDSKLGVWDHGFTEPSLGGNAALQMTLAAMAAHAAGDASVKPNFPPPDPRNDSTDYRTTDREFFVQASLASSNNTSVTLRTELHNRSAWPARVTDKLSFRYFFGADGGAQPSDYTAQVQSPDGAKLVGIAEHSSGVYYAEVSFEGVSLWPNKIGNVEHFRRGATLTVRGPSGDRWNTGNDWSFDGLNNQLGIRPRIAVYDNGTLVGGEEP